MIVNVKICHKSEYNSVYDYQDFYTENPKTCPDYGRIINQRHFKRVMAMLENSTIAVGGENDESDCYIGIIILACVTIKFIIMNLLTYSIVTMCTHI